MPWALPSLSDASQAPGPMAMSDFTFEMLGTDLADIWADWPGSDFGQ